MVVEWILMSGDFQWDVETITILEIRVTLDKSFFGRIRCLIRIERLKFFTCIININLSKNKNYMLKGMNKKNKW